MKHYQIGKKVSAQIFERRLGKKAKCSMCFEEIPWYAQGIKITSSQMTGHLAFHDAPCFGDFIKKLINIQGELE